MDLPKPSSEDNDIPTYTACIISSSVPDVTSGVSAAPIMKYKTISMIAAIASIILAAIEKCSELRFVFKKA